MLAFLAALLFGFAALFSFAHIHVWPVMGLACLAGVFLSLHLAGVWTAVPWRRGP